MISMIIQGVAKGIGDTVEVGSGIQSAARAKKVKQFAGLEAQTIRARNTQAIQREQNDQLSELLMEADPLADPMIDDPAGPSPDMLR